MVDVRPLSNADVEPLAMAMAQAFDRDDLALWIFPDPAERLAGLLSMFRSRLADALGDDRMTVDVASDLSGAAIWQSPNTHGEESPPPGARPEVVSAFRAVNSARPQASHWYLHGIGARDGGRGVGSALMQAGLGRLDRLGVPSALFTGAAGNVSFYKRHSYRELWRSDLPGVSLWWMWRDPQEAADPRP